MGPESAVITAGNIRAAARQLVQDLPASDEPLYLYTDSAAELCAGILAAQLSGRMPVLLPQAGAAYCDHVGAERQLLAGNAAHAGTEIRIGASGHDATLDINPSTTATLTFFTSGSSGEAKRIEKPMHVIDAEAEFWRDWFDGAIAHVTGSVSHQHIYGLIFRVVLPVISGIPSSDRLALSWEALLAPETNGLLVVSSPAHLTRPPSARFSSQASPAWILSSGGPLPEADADTINSLFGASPLEILGSTETGGVATRQRHKDGEWWTPLPVVQTIAGSEQELLVSSPFLSDPGSVRMGDRVELSSDGRFCLAGRLDRIVKIEGKRIALPRVETILKQHAGIIDAAVVMTDHKGQSQLSAVVTLDENAKKQLGKLGRFRMARSISASLSNALEPAERPRRWRFVSDIPVNAQSKRTQSSLEALFTAPDMLELLAPDTFDVDGFTAELSFIARPDLPWFQGHFSEMPVLPGLAQVHIAVRLAEEIWAAGPASMNVNRLKFHRLVTPDENVSVKLSFRPEAKKLEFAFSHCNARVSTGLVG